VGANSWTTPTNIVSSNNAYAVQGTAGTSHYLKATGFSFAIPSGSHIRGVLVEWEMVGAAGQSVENIIKLLKGGAVSGTDKSTGAGIPTGEGFVGYGGDGDLWGLTLTPADVNAANFGAVLSIINNVVKEGHGSVSVDSVRITIYYDPPDHGFFLRILGQ
jgi:hypothetical protein